MSAENNIYHDPSFSRQSSNVSNDSIPSTLSEKGCKCTCDAAEQLEQVINVNHYWKKDYTNLMTQHNSVKARLITTEQQKQIIEKENQSLRQRLQYLESRNSSPSAPPPSPHLVSRGIQDNQITTSAPPPSPLASTLVNSVYTKDDIEALKHQLIIYKEDFEHEKEDRSRLTNENNQLKGEIQNLRTMLEQLSKKNDTMKENYRRVNTEKEHIINELRRLTTASNPSSPNPLPRSPRNGQLSNPYLPKGSDYGIPKMSASEDTLPPPLKISPPFYGGHVERD